MDENFFVQIIKNRVLMTSLIAWVVAQSMKVALGVIREKRFNFKWFIGTGGMPSSHVSGMMALASSVGFVCGFSSYQFAIAFVLALIVMFDAQGVRRSSGRQGRGYRAGTIRLRLCLRSLLLYFFWTSWTKRIFAIIFCIWLL